jgi:hypothetical protein
MKNEIISDPVSLEQFKRMNYASSCEDCTHFESLNEKCTFKYPTTPHLRRNQLASLEKSGRMAFCRTIEID